MMIEVVDEAVRLIVEFSAAAIVPLLFAWFARQVRRLGLELSAERRAELERIVQDAVLEVEEWAAARAKRRLPVTSAAKLQAAIERIARRAPGISDEEASALVHQALPRLGLGAVDFLRRAREAVKTPDPGAA